jgi:hypothetical protein
MPRNPKDSEHQDDDDDIGAPRVDEIDPDASPDRTPARLDDDEEELNDDEIEEIDISDLSAMEGPDA